MFVNESADAAPRLQNPGTLQFRVDLGYCISIDSQIYRQLPHRRQLVTDPQLSRSDGELNRPLQLVVKRRRMFGVDMEHFELPYCTTTIEQVKFQNRQPRFDPCACLAASN